MVENLSLFNAEAPKPKPAKARISLRDYQEEAVNAVLEGWTEHDSVMITVPTGGGKTIIASSLIGERLEHGRILFLAHREELLHQTVDKASMVLGDIDAGVVQADLDEHRAQIVVGSVQTLSRERRLERVLAYGDFATVIIDECHHATATTYRKIMDRMKAGKPGGPKLLGVTATPDRADKVGLMAVFEKIVYELGIFDLIDRGHLVDIVAKEIEIDGLDLSGVRTSRGDYVASDLSRALLENHTPEIVAKAMHELIPERKSIVFVPSVAMAEETAAAIREMGIKAGFVSGGTPKDERKQILEDLDSGALRAVVNVGVLTEGFDSPSVDAVVMAAPTKSRTKFVQCIGRGLRLNPGKEDCVVLDLTPNSRTHELQSVPTLFGLPPKDFKKKSLRQVVEQARMDIKAGKYTGDLKITDLGNLRKQRFHWVTLPNGWHALPSKDVTLILRYGGVTPMGVPGWEVWQVKGGQAERVREAVPLEYAQSGAEEELRNAGSHTSILVQEDAPWRSGPASEKQLSLCRNVGTVANRDKAGSTSLETDST
ncbi:uncharacterized protein [Tenebrio molitor]|uniref:uncharacterized protein n=1 Tax=Tenebrio molitor TaxID=7067 RepID=UPI0036249679